MSLVQIIIDRLKNQEITKIAETAESSNTIPHFVMKEGCRVPVYGDRLPLKERLTLASRCINEGFVGEYHHEPAEHTMYITLIKKTHDEHIFEGFSVPVYYSELKETEGILDYFNKKGE